MVPLSYEGLRSFLTLVGGGSGRGDRGFSSLVHLVAMAIWRVEVAAGIGHCEDAGAARLGLRAPRRQPGSSPSVIPVAGVLAALQPLREVLAFD